MLTKKHNWISKEAVPCAAGAVLYCNHASAVAGPSKVWGNGKVHPGFGVNERADSRLPPQRALFSALAIETFTSSLAGHSHLRLESAPLSPRSLLYTSNKHTNIIPIKLQIRTVPPHGLLRVLETYKIFILFRSRSVKRKISSNNKGGIVKSLLAELLRRRGGMKVGSIIIFERYRDCGHRGVRREKLNEIEALLRAEDTTSLFH